MLEPATASQASALPSDALDFLAAPGRHAAIATIDPDGRARHALAWYRLDGSTIVVNSLVGRRWPTNLRRDRHISILVSNGPDWVSVDGTVEVVEEQSLAQADIAAMARAYETPAEAAVSIARFVTQRRISFRVIPERVHVEIGA